MKIKLSTITQRLKMIIVSFKQCLHKVGFNFDLKAEFDLKVELDVIHVANSYTFF